MRPPAAYGAEHVFSTQREMDLLRQRLRADRQRTDKQRLELMTAMAGAMAVRWQHVANVHEHRDDRARVERRRLGWLVDDTFFFLFG